MPNLSWLPERDDWPQSFQKMGKPGDPGTWDQLLDLARARLGFGETLQLDRALLKRHGQAPPEALATRPVRLALLGSSTVDHLAPGIRVGSLRRNLWTTIYVPPYAQYQQELLDPQSGLHQFQPNAVLFAFDADHLFGLQTPVAAADADALLEETGERLRGLWRTARERFGAQVLQQAVVPRALPLLGENEQRMPLSQRTLTSRLNDRLRTMADAEGVDVVDVNRHLFRDGLSAWHNPALWYKAKQEISPVAGPFYGDLVARLLAAAQGRSAKCLVLDLDNTLWGGVIGDDGLEGIELGQGNAVGEAYLAVQRYALGLSRRGVILAVCSKNDEAAALGPFEKHPEMVLKRSDIACFVANWKDKPANLREIAGRLNIGLDSLVFLDDNPFERNIVRRETPEVSVPELPDDPALFAETLAEAGYFEALRLTEEDRARAEQYQANAQREQLKAESTDLEGYLKSLRMELRWSPFDRVGLPRVVQLINKTNQFNLTTQRLTESEVAAYMEDPRAITLQLRLLDRFGDNGIIGVVMAAVAPCGAARIDTWLMSCRVLGRGVEQATLGLIAAEARRLGAEELVGDYLPTAKNGMVRDHYARLGFTPAGDLPGGGSRWHLRLKSFVAPSTFISIQPASP